MLEFGRMLENQDVRFANPKYERVRDPMIGILREIRRQHGREHATVAVMLERGARPPLGGNATPGGFFIYSKETTESVVEAAEEGLRRLQTNQPELAVSPYCGTNILVGAVVALIVSSIVRGRSNSISKRISSLIIGIVISQFLRRPIGGLVQRHLTTLPDSDGVSIKGIKAQRIGGMTIHWVSTGRSST